ncbi:MAG: YdeI/OmpD-associated family protein [Myxococcota bacterium]
MSDDRERVAVASPSELRRWLETHHGQTEGVWLVTFKKHAGDRYVSTGQVLDELLCFGWIDGRRMKLDDDRTMQLISPRRVQHWSKTYKDRAAKLIEEGRMAAPGLAAIERSKADGMWTFLDDVDALVQPPDLVAAFEAHPPAQSNFDAFPPSTQRFALRWIKLAKSGKARANRITKTAELAAQGKKVPGA